MKLGEKVTWVLEPRLQATQSFGDAKLEEFDDSELSNINFTCGSPTNHQGLTSGKMALGLTLAAA